VGARETARINEALVPEGLVYGGGLGEGLRPHFFLARLVRREEHDGCTVLVSDEEYARGLSAPPALSLGGLVFLRRAALRQLLWEKVEEWRWSRRPDSPMGRAIACHPFGRDPAAALEAMTEEPAACSARAGKGCSRPFPARGWSWRPAPCGTTSPTAFPPCRRSRTIRGPGASTSCSPCCVRGETGPLRAVAARGAEHWAGVARELLALHEQGGAAAVPEMEALLGRAAL